MPSRTTSRRWLALTAGMATITLAACGGDDGDSGGDALADVTSDVDCAAFEEYGDLEGTEVTLYTSIISPEDQPFIDSFIPFEECTGAEVSYEGSRDFEAQLQVRLQAGNPPDIAFVPQPGLLNTIATTFPDKVAPVSDVAVSNVDEYYDPLWKELGTVDGNYVAAPLGANVKSFVWYSPTAFEEGGYEIPTTQEELLALTDQIVADNPEAKPWCAGIESGTATGWTATDWLEDYMLRTAGPDVYDQWVAHEIPFNDPQVVDALDEVGGILRNADYVNGGLGGVESIATTAFSDAGIPIPAGNCYMMRQASFYQANWDEELTVAEDGDVFAFYLPGETETDKPLLLGGEFTLAFADRPEVAAFQGYLTSPEWSNVKAQLSGPGWISANTELNPDNLVSPIDQLSVELLTDEEATLRFDGSDLMPAAVGSGTFWTAMTDWIALGTSSEDVLTSVESSWPSE
ncbi:MAG: ABC transporter substrate-binding protein [Ornithinimicrobium sp.]